MPTAVLRQQKVHSHLKEILYQVRQAAYRTKHPIPKYEGSNLHVGGWLSANSHYC